MWIIFKVQEPYQWIQRCGRSMWRNRNFLLKSVILTTSCLGLMLLYRYKDDVISERKHDSAEKIENANYLMVDNVALLTLFTSWADRKDKYVVQNRTVENWISLWPHIQPVIFTNDTKLGGQCRQKGWSVLPLKVTAADGFPVVKYMYLDAMHNFNSTFYGYANSDILFNDGIVKTLVKLKEFVKVNRFPVLVTGRRINVDYKLPCNVSDWRNITRVSKKGKLVNPVSADHFITTKDYPWEDMDDIIIGHILIDNWIIQFSQLQNVIVIDSTPTILALHQTTETGNDESHYTSNKFYNDEIVRKVRNITINPNQGRTDCSDYVTNFTTSEHVQLIKQTPQSICKGDNSSKAEKRILHPLLINSVLFLCILITHE